jgi:hypothetical protein
MAARAVQHAEEVGAHDGVNQLRRELPHRGGRLADAGIVYPVINAAHALHRLFPEGLHLRAAPRVAGEPVEVAAGKLEPQPCDRLRDGVPRSSRNHYCAAAGKELARHAKPETPR